MKNAWKQNRISRFATNRAETQRLFNNLLGLMGSPSAHRGAVQTVDLRVERCRLEMGKYRCASLRLRVS